MKRDTEFLKKVRELAVNNNIISFTPVQFLKYLLWNNYPFGTPALPDVLTVS